MKKLKIALLIGTALIVAAGGFVYFKIKNLGDPNKIIEAQISKQYTNEVKTTAKRELDFKHFEKYMNEMDSNRYKELGTLIVESDIEAIQRNIASEEFSIEELVVFYLKRIKEYDVDKLNTVVELNPDAISIAQELDKMRKKGDSKGKLFGIPVLLKDNIGTGDRMHNTAGAAALKEARCDRDAFIVKKLRESGAIILGKANLSEWANFMSIPSSNGYSTLGGQTHNAYGNFDVGGSSSGSASAASANLATVTIGSETAGSMIYPSSQNGVVGIKPSIGVLSRDRIIPIAHDQDTAGPIGRNVQDAAILLGELVGRDENDKDTLEAVKDGKVDYTQFLQKDGLKGMKIGLVINESVAGGYRKGDSEILDRVVNELRELGADVKEIKLDESAFAADYMNTLLYEYKKGVGEYLEAIGDNAPVKNIEEIIEFNKKDLENRAAYGQALIEMAQDSKITEEENQNLVKENRRITGEAIDKALKEEKVDVLLTLSNYLSGVYAPAGYPAITVPAGYRENREPIGLTLVSSKYEEGTLIKAAYSYEQGTKHRVKPNLNN